MPWSPYPARVTPDMLIMDRDGLTGQSLAQTPDDQSGTVTDQSQVPPSTTPAPVDPGNLPKPDVQGIPGPPPQVTADQIPQTPAATQQTIIPPGQMPPKVLPAQLDPSLTPPSVPNSPSPSGQQAPNPAPPQAPMAQPPPPLQAQASMPPQGAGPQPIGGPPPPQAVQPTNADQTISRLQSAMSTPRPSTPPAWKQILAAMAGVSSLTAPLAPLIAYGPKGLAQERAYEQAQSQIPNLTKIGQLERESEANRATQTEAQARLAETARQHAADQAKAALEEADKQSKEVSDFTSLNKGGRIIQEGVVPPNWSKVPSASYDPQGTMRILPDMATVTPELANSAYGKLVGLQAGDPLTRTELTHHTTGAASMAVKEKPTPETADQIKALANQYAPAGKYPEINSRLNLDLLDANVRGDATASRAAIARASDQMAALEKEKVTQANKPEPGTWSFAQDKDGKPVMFNTKTGQTKATDISKSDSGAVANRKYSADVVTKAGDSLIASIEKNRGKVGNLGSYWNQATNNTPISDPDTAGLMTQIATFAALQPGLHGFRGGNAMKEFEKIIGGVPKNPDALIASIKAIQGTAKIMEGKQNATAAPNDPLGVR
jgi:hypothetical protein